jgi:glycosyltransferase involved in cell wall biosynthesis
MENMGTMPQISFVIPCLNEEKTLPSVLNAIKETIAQLPYVCEIIVADNNSQDASRTVALSLGAQVVVVSQRGYGAALAGGISRARGKIIVMADADMTYDFKDSVPMIKLLIAENLDMCIGNRLAGRIESGAMPFLHRYLGTPVLSFLIRFIYNISIHDANCGLRVFTTDAFQRLAMISDGMEFASEMLVKAGLLRQKLKEIPCSLNKGPSDRVAHLHTWRDGWRHLKFILLFAPNHLFKYPGYFFFFLSLLGLLLLTPGAITLGRFVFDYHFMLLFSVLLLVGHQMIWLANFEQRLVYSTGWNFRQLDGRPDSFAMDRWLLVAFSLKVTALILFIYIGYHWWQSGHISLLEKRLLIWAVNFMALAMLTAANAFMVDMLKTR